MVEYISRDAASAIIEEQQKALCPIGRWGRRYVDGTDRDKYDELQAVLDTIDELPTADVAEVRPELRKAVKLLEKNYERGLNSDFVRDPLAWALYQTWKEIDGGADNG